MYINSSTLYIYITCTCTCMYSVYTCILIHQHCTCILHVQCIYNLYKSDLHGDNTAPAALETTRFQQKYTRVYTISTTHVNILYTHT